MAKELLSCKDVYEVYGEPFTYSFLERGRRTGEGPKFLKAGPGRTSKIYYRRSDIEAWIDGNMRTSTADDQRLEAS